MTCSAAQPAHTAPELATEAVTRVHATDTGDAAATLPAAWNGLGIAEAASRLLVRSSRRGAVFACNAVPVPAAIALRRLQVPSLPCTGPVGATVVDLVSPDHLVRVRPVLVGDSYSLLDFSPAAGVRQTILVLAPGRNAPLSRVASAARGPADRTACEHGTGPAYELGRCRRACLGFVLDHDGIPVASDPPVDRIPPGRHRSRSGSTGRRKNGT